MKRALSMLLAIVMVFGLVPVAAFAAGETTISFETTFTDEMTVGDTFTVVANLADNELFLTMTLSLKWNEDVVKFTGFNTTARGALETEVYTYTAPTVNHELGIVTGYDAYGFDTNGKIFTANFEIIGTGELGIGLKDADATEFEMVDGSYAAINPVIDFSAIENLAVPGAEPDGPVIPDGAPFTAVTTDAGAAIAIDQQDDVNGVPYYIVTIPEDATTAYVTAPDQVVMEDWNTGEMQATAYAAEVENGWNQLYISYNYEDTADGPKVEIPMNMTATDWSGEVELCFVEDEYGDLTHAFGIEDSEFACLGYISFRYGRPGGEEAPETYSITIDENITGGTVSAADEDGNVLTEAAEGTYVYLNVQPDDGYKLKGFSVADSVGPIGADNGFFQMPAGDVTITAAFAPIHTCTYDQEVADEKYLKSEATCLSGAVYYKSCTCGAFDNSDTAATFTSGEYADHNYVDGKCEWCEKEEPTGYFFATSADISAENGGSAVVSVKITGHSDENVTGYNAYDVTLTFDTDKLELATDEEGNYIYSGAVKTDNGSVTVNGNTIRIVGCGADKAFGTEIAALTFKTKAEGNANVTISKVQVSDKEESVKEDAPEATPKHDENDTTADTTPDQSVVLVPYTVTKPNFVSGETSVLHGEDYTFSYTDTVNYTYSGLKVTVGGTDVTPTEAEGVYTIANVTGTVIIEATQTPNSYDVTKPANVTGLDKATYGIDYIFTVTPSEGKVIDTVTVTTANGSAIPYTIKENGEYVIAGTDISGPFTITVTEKDKPVTTTTTITFTGVEATEVVGGLTQTATIGQEFTFQLNKDEKFTYTAKVGETDLVETPATDEAPAFYTIPAELVVESGVTVTITKTAVSNLKVEVSTYFNTDGAVMFLVIAKDGEKVLTYGEEAMFYSDKYALTGEEAGAYCWLVSSGDDADTVKAAAVASIKAAEETVDAPVVAYDCDVNQTTKVDVNDAQLAYDMYKGVYGITESVTMDKFLEADISTDRKLDVNDVAAIINFIVNGTSN